MDYIYGECPTEYLEKTLIDYYHLAGEFIKNKKSIPEDLRVIIKLLVQELDRRSELEETKKSSK